MRDGCDEIGLCFVELMKRRDVTQHDHHTDNSLVIGDVEYIFIEIAFLIVAIDLQLLPVRVILQKGPHQVVGDRDVGGITACNIRFLQPEQLFSDGIEEQDIPFIVQTDDPVPHLVDDRLYPALLEFDLCKIAALVFIQLFSHGVEGIRQIAEFVGLLEIDPLLVILVRDGADTFGKTADRTGYNARQVEDKGKGYKSEYREQDRQHLFGPVRGLLGGCILPHDGHLVQIRYLPDSAAYIRIIARIGRVDQQLVEISRQLVRRLLLTYLRYIGL